MWASEGTFSHIAALFKFTIYNDFVRVLCSQVHQGQFLTLIINSDFIGYITEV